MDESIVEIDVRRVDVKRVTYLGTSATLVDVPEDVQQRLTVFGCVQQTRAPGSVSAQAEVANPVRRAMCY